ncbi:MAG TPA: hypothetical protein VMT98_01455 [Verrucomicrobiae bacterium]|nr:hypothetical protein [Verrucomicrobiae bacterium]
MRVAVGLGRRLSAVLTAAVSALLLASGGAGAVSRDAECDDLDVAVEPAADFRTIDCKAGQTGYGGETGWSNTESIEAQDALSVLFVYHSRAGVQTYLERVDPKTLFSDSIDIAVKGSWSATTVTDGYSIAKFFSVFEGETETVPCFAYSRYGGHVAGTGGYRHMVAGFYCELVPSDSPVSEARIEQMIGKIKADMF